MWFLKLHFPWKQPPFGLWPKVRDCCCGGISSAFVQQTLKISGFLQFPLCICFLCEVLFSISLVGAFFCGKYNCQIRSHFTLFCYWRYRSWITNHSHRVHFPTFSKIFHFPAGTGHINKHQRSTWGWSKIYISCWQYLYKRDCIVKTLKVIGKKKKKEKRKNTKYE